MAEKKQDAAAVFVEGTRSNQIYNLALQGLSIQQIADKLNVTEENIRQIVNRQKTQISLQTQELQEQWSSITMGRTEYLLQKLFAAIDKQSENEGVPGKDLIKMTLDVMKFQQTIAMPENQDKGRADVVITQTFVTGGQLYDEALQAAQGELLGYTVHKVEEPTMIIADERMTKIERLASEILTEQELYDSDSADTDED